MFGFTKKCFFTGLAFLTTLTSVNLLSCISMNNKECRIRPQIVKITSKQSTFFPLVLKQSNAAVVATVSIIRMQNCVPNIVKNVNVKVFNLMSRTNETRQIEWHETCKCKCRLDGSVCNNKQRWNDDK